MPRRLGMAPRYVTTHQAAVLLGVSAATVVNWVTAGHLAAHRTLGGHRRIPSSELLALAAARGIDVLWDAAPPEDPPVRVLLVDDDADFAELIAGYIEQKHGWTVEVVTSGFAAGVAVARARPAVVVLDLVMPGFDGMAVAKAFSADEGLQNVPIVAMSGHAHLLTEARARQVFAATLCKPVDLQELSSVLTFAIGGGTSERRATW